MPATRRLLGRGSGAKDSDDSKFEDCIDKQAKKAIDGVCAEGFAGGMQRLEDVRRCLITRGVTVIALAQTFTNVADIEDHAFNHIYPTT